MSSILKITLLKVTSTYADGSGKLHYTTFDMFCIFTCKLSLLYCDIYNEYLYVHKKDSIVPTLALIFYSINRPTLMGMLMVKLSRMLPLLLRNS